MMVFGHDMVFTIRYGMRIRSWTFFLMSETADFHRCEMKHGYDLLCVMLQVPMSPE